MSNGHCCFSGCDTYECSCGEHPCRRQFHICDPRKVVRHKKIRALQSKAQAQLQERTALAEEILSSEPFMWLMAGGDHTEAHAQALRPLWLKWKEAGGKSWGEGPNAEVSLASPLDP